MSCCAACKKRNGRRRNPSTRYSKMALRKVRDQLMYDVERHTRRLASGGWKHAWTPGGNFAKTDWIVERLAALRSGAIPFRKAKNPNFLYMTPNGRRRKNAASQNFIYEANGRRKKRGLTRDRRGRFKRRGGR